MKIRIKQLNEFKLGMDHVTTSYYVEVVDDGEWIVSFLEKINPFSYITFFIDSSGKNSVEFYHDNRGWIPTEIHDEYIFGISLQIIDSLGKYHSAIEIEQILIHIIKYNKFRELS